MEFSDYANKISVKLRRDVILEPVNLSTEEVEKRGIEVDKEKEERMEKRGRRKNVKRMKGLSLRRCGEEADFFYININITFVFVCWIIIYSLHDFLRKNYCLIFERIRQYRERQR